VPTKHTPPPPLHTLLIFFAVLAVAAVIAREDPTAMRELADLVLAVSVAVGLTGREPQ
jgi:hypothetical protein